MTLRVRFALWVAGLLLGVLAAFGTFVYFSLKHGLEASIDDSLRLSASQAITTINVEDGQIDFSDALPENDPTLSLRERGLTLRILDPAGQVLQAFGPYRALPVEPSCLAAAQAGQSGFATLNGPSEGDPVRVYTEPVVESGRLVGVVQVAQSLEGVGETLERLLSALLLGGPLLVLVAALGGYLLAARALAPIDHITRTARRISAQDLSARLNLPATKDEVGRLATTFDEMLARLDDSFRRERRFTADASHELRSPVTAILGQAEFALSRARTPTDYQAILTRIRQEAERMQRLIGRMLTLARVETGRHPLHIAPTDIPRLLNTLVDTLQPQAAAKGLTLNVTTPAALTIATDADSLTQILLNLLENAIHYTDQGHVDLVATPSADSLQIRVSDTGQGIPPEHLPHLFQPFYRVDPSRSQSRGNVGLGLTLTYELAQLLGGQIEVTSQPQVGTTFTLVLPNRRVYSPLKIVNSGQ